MDFLITVLAVLGYWMSRGDAQRGAKLRSSPGWASPVEREVRNALERLVRHFAPYALPYAITAKLCQCTPLS